MVEKYRPPVGPSSNEISNNEPKEYIPPVGPGSKSVTPNGTFRDLPPGLLPEIRKVKD